MPFPPRTQRPEKQGAWKIQAPKTNNAHCLLDRRSNKVFFFCSFGVKTLYGG